MYYEIKDHSFNFDGNKLAGVLFRTTIRQRSPGVLFLHGAGKTSSVRYTEWQEYLCERGYTSFIFESRGVGESEGVLEDGGLSNRLRDSEKALDEFLALDVIDPDNICVIGSSMGGHIAVRLAEKRKNVKAIILAYAAAYSEEAESKKLDSTFTEAIRKENSWVDSPAFEILKQYSGKLLVVYGESEEVIPHGVQKEYLDLANRKGEGHIVKNIGHAMLQPKNEKEEEATKELFSISANFLDKTFGTK